MLAINRQAAQYLDSAGKLCSGPQLFNFFRNMRRVYTAATKEKNKSGGPGPAKAPKQSALTDKCIQVFQKDLRAIVRRDHFNKQTSSTVCMFVCFLTSQIIIPLKIDNFKNRFLAIMSSQN